LLKSFNKKQGTYTIKDTFPEGDAAGDEENLLSSASFIAIFSRTLTKPINI